MRGENKITIWGTGTPRVNFYTPTIVPTPSFF